MPEENDKPQSGLVSFWATHGIAEPRIGLDAIALRDFLLRGNGAGGNTLAERIAQWKTTVEQYVGRKVRNRDTHKMGVVIKLTPRYPREVRSIKDKCSCRQGLESSAEVEPYIAYVGWIEGGNKRRATYASLHLLQLINDA